MARASILQLPREKLAFMAQSDNLKFMRPLRNETMQLVVTSPPYNIGKAYEKRSSLDAYVQAKHRSSQNVCGY
jgi:adenine-specific DNA-methyltransferase